MSTLEGDEIHRGQQRVRLDESLVRVEAGSDGYREHLSNVRLNGTFRRFYEPTPGQGVYGGVELTF